MLVIFTLRDRRTLSQMTQKATPTSYHLSCYSQKKPLTKSVKGMGVHSTNGSVVSLTKSPTDQPTFC